MTMTTTAATDWQPVCTISPTDLQDTRRQLHWACQIVSAVGATLLEPRDDDSHTAMIWDADRQLIVGEPVQQGKTFRAALDMDTFSIALLDENSNEIDQCGINGKSYAMLIAWLTHAIEEYTGQQLDNPLVRNDYELPDHDVSHGAPFTAEPDKLRELRAWLHDGDMLLRRLVEHHDLTDSTRLWPHHFDIANLIYLDKEKSKTVGPGLEMGDSTYNEPYWFVRAYPQPEGADLPDLDGGGHWHTEGFVAAVLTASDVKSDDPAEQKKQMIAYLDSAVGASIKLLK